MQTDLHSSRNIQDKFLGSIKMIQHVKNDPILQVSSQEPSTSSKPACKQKLTFSRSLAELRLANLFLTGKLLLHSDDSASY